VSQWTESEILPAGRSGLAADPAAALERTDDKHYVARWTWPPPAVAGQCRIAVCRQPPKPQAGPDAVPSVYSTWIERDRWEAAGCEHRFAIEPDWDGAHVLVWAVVDLGFQVFYSHAVELGQIELGPKKRRWRVFK
jgi:hypothetical protein